MNRAALAIGFLILALVAGLLWQRHAAERPLDKVGAVRIAAPVSLPGALVAVAAERGLFTRAGVDVALWPCDVGRVCAEAMVRGDADMSLAAELTFTHLSFTRKNLRILGVTAYVHATRLLGLKDKGVAGPDDLKGKRVGFIPNTISEYYLARLLTLRGMRREDITWVALTSKEMVAALMAGEVDAVMAFSPFSHQIEVALPGRLSSSDGQPGQDYYHLLLSQQDWLEKNPQVAERVLLALKWAGEWMADHPDETRAFLAARYGLPEALLVEDMRSTRFFIGLPQTLLSVIEAENRWLEEQGAKGSPVSNTLDLIAFEPMVKVAPESVTIVRGRSGRDTP